jgi:hypothetical protein
MLHIYAYVSYTTMYHLDTQTSYATYTPHIPPTHVLIQYIYHLHIHTIHTYHTHSTHTCKPHMDIFHLHTHVTHATYTYTASVHVPYCIYADAHPTSAPIVTPFRMHHALLFRPSSCSLPLSCNLYRVSSILVQYTRIRHLLAPTALSPRPS